jgi:hypothetical protein
MPWSGDFMSAIMCSEAVWWRRRRRIVARLTPDAVIQPDRTILYPGVPRLDV